jgi:hypothetical protein
MLLVDGFSCDNDDDMHGEMMGYYAKSILRKSTNQHTNPKSVTSILMNLMQHKHTISKTAHC